MSKFYWSEDTIMHFKFESAYVSKAKLRESIKEFVEIDCTLEDGETEEMLVNDLLEKIYN